MQRESWIVYPVVIVAIGRAMGISSMEFEVERRRTSRGIFHSRNLVRGMAEGAKGSDGLAAKRNAALVGVSTPH